MKIQLGDFQKMRLYNTYFLCKNLVETCRSLRVTERISNKSYYIENWNEYKNTLLALREVPLFSIEADNIIKAVPAYVREDSRPEISDEIRRGLEGKNARLYARMDTIIELYESMGLEDAKNGIDVKIPECEDLKEYIWYLKELDFVFYQCPYLKCDSETVKFDSVDVGSNWIYFAILFSSGATTAYVILNHLGILLNKALILKSHYLSVKQQEEALKVALKKEKLADSEMEIFDVLKKHYMDEMVSGLQSEIGELKDGEEIGKVEKTLEKLCNLLDKGVEIYASLDTPQNVQVLFPELGETPKLKGDVLQFLEDKLIKNE